MRATALAIAILLCGAAAHAQRVTEAGYFCESHTAAEMAFKASQEGNTLLLRWLVASEQCATIKRGYRVDVLQRHFFGLGAWRVLIHGDHASMAYWMHPMFLSLADGSSRGASDE